MLRLTATQSQGWVALEEGRRQNHDLIRRSVLSQELFPFLGVVLQADQKEQNLRFRNMLRTLSCPVVLTSDLLPVSGEDGLR